MGTAACTVVGQAYGTQGSSINYSTSNTAYAGFNYSGWYPYVLKFTTPSFSGKVTSIVIDLSVLRGNRNGAASAAVSLRYALCKSDANFSSYNKTAAAVTDANQIVVGRISFTALTSAYEMQTLTIATDALAANTTYYLILWGDNTGGYSQDYCRLNAATNHAVQIQTAEGLVYIDNGTSLDAYEVYIDNGTTWERYAPYIDNGTSWGLCG